MGSINNSHRQPQKNPSTCCDLGLVPRLGSPMGRVRRARPNEVGSGLLLPGLCTLEMAPAAEMHCAGPSPRSPELI